MFEVCQCAARPSPLHDTLTRELNRNGRICEYPSGNSPDHSRHESRPRGSASGDRLTPGSEISLSAQPVTPLSGGQPAFPSVFFLDASIFQQAQLELPKAGVIVPSYVNELIGDTRRAEEAASYFFEHIHPWMPVISKRRFYRHLLNPLLQLREDTALLLLSIKLITWWPSSHSKTAHTSLYLASKRYLAELQTAGIFSIQIVQASVLITLYELGHSIYPAAYFSIGVCGRYGAVLELDKDVNLHKSDGSTPWDELEERRRIWWAILILDRYVSRVLRWLLATTASNHPPYYLTVTSLMENSFINLGSPLRIRTTKDPGPEDVLPTDDTVWENSVSPCSSPYRPLGLTYGGQRDTPRKTYTVSSPSDMAMGRFARFAQATYLLGRVLNHLSDLRGDEALHAAESMQLNRTILALVNLSQCEGQIRNLEFCTQISTCYR